MKKISLWGALWRSKNRMDGVRVFLLFDPANCLPALFKTRKQARAWIEEHYVESRTRKDLRREPHGWRLPKAVRVAITVDEEGKP